MCYNGKAKHFICQTARLKYNFCVNVKDMRDGVIHTAKLVIS